MASEDFVHLHLHTHASGFDGLGLASEFAERAAKMGQPAFAVTEHGTLLTTRETAASDGCGGLGFLVDNFKIGTVNVYHSHDKARNRA